MDESNERFHELLRQWPDIEPRAAFAADVRRRIRLATPEPVSRWTCLMPVGAAVSVALCLSAWLGRLPAPRPAATPTTFLAADSLAGSYLKLTGGLP